MNRRIPAAFCLVLALSALAVAVPQDWYLDWLALQESLESLRPWQRIRSLADRGLYRDYCAQSSWVPDSQGLSCIGRWSYGPSYKVSVHTVGLDTIILLTRGSGATLARFRTTGQVAIEPLGEIDCHGIPHRAVMSGSLVCVGVQRGGTGLELFDVSDLTAPRRTAQVSLPSVNDIAVADSLVYLACADDSLRIYSIADPSAPVRVGACRDTSDLAMCYADGYCYLVHASGVNIVDVRDPRNPRRAGKIAGNAPLAVQVRDSLCYMTTESQGLRVYDVVDPATPFPVGSLSVPAAVDLCLPQSCDTLAVTSYLHIISIANPSSPRLIGQVNSPGWDDGVGIAPALDYAFIADHFDGVVAVDLANPTSPAIDTMALAGGLAVDINVDNSRAYIGSQYTGLTVLDVTNPALPRTLGSYDTVGQQPVFTSAIGRDSFAYLGWPRPRVLTIDVGDPTRPVRAAGCEGMFAWPEDMVLRDSWLFCAEASRFQVVNVARPREPRLVGSCVTQDGNYFGLAVQDSLAYLISGSLQVVNIAQPTSPWVLSSTPVFGFGVAVRDTFVYVPYGYDTLRIYSAANPSSLRLLGYAPLGSHAWDVALTGSHAVVGTWNGLVLVDVSDPQSPANIATISTPRSTRRVVVDSGLIYAAMYEAGIGVYEVESTGIAESGEAERRAGCVVVVPSPTAGRCMLRLSGQRRERLTVCVVDVSGREVMRRLVAEGSGSAELDVSALSAGVYTLVVSAGRTTSTARVIKR